VFFLHRRRDALIAGGSGLVFAASSPPTDIQLGILIGLVGFAFAVGTAADAEKVVRTGAARGFWFGLAANVFALRFVPEVIGRFTALPSVAQWTALVLLSAAQALPWAVGGALAAWLARRRDSKPFAPAFLAFAIGIYAATFVPAVFPWTPAGGLAHWPILLQTAELVGERGTSFLVALGCSLIAEGIARVLRRGPAEHDQRYRLAAKPLATSAAVFLVLLVYGGVRIRAVEAQRAAAPHARVALLQPDFDAMFRWEEHRAQMMMDRLTALTKRAEAAGAILTIWPESAYPYTLAHGVKSSAHGVRAVLQPGVHGPVLTGAYLAKGGGLGTNSAILVQPNGDIGPSYDKRHLLWFGETVPLADVFPILRQIFARGTGLAPGTESIAFRTGPIVAAVLNCYEDTLPTAGREAMAQRPNLVVNVTNDAWFVGSAEGELHLRLSVLRSIETRRDLVRAVNRGPTSWVGATGHVLMRRDPTPGLGPSPPLLADAALLDAPITLYTRAGDLPLVVLVLAALAYLSRQRLRAYPRDRLG
jgi:apolipoprotein N-acyltransferase